MSDIRYVRHAREYDEADWAVALGIPDNEKVLSAQMVYCVAPGAVTADPVHQYKLIVTTEER